MVPGLSRRAFLIGAAAATPFPGRAFGQNSEPLLGVVMGGGAFTRPDLIEALTIGLAQEGWVPSVNLRLEVRGAEANRSTASSMAAELLGLGANAILANTTVVAEEVLRLTDSVPVVFMPVGDPIGSGFVETYGRPGGNATGFTNFEPSHVGKWVEFLLQVRPGLRTIGLIYNPDTSPRRGRFYLDPFLEIAAQGGFEPVSVEVHTESDIEPAIAALAARPESGLVAQADVYMINNRRSIIAAVDRHKIPAIYPFINFTEDGGLISYSIDTVEIFRRGGAYLGRILSGEDPATLPVQSPERFELAVNLATAREQGFVVPNSLIAIAHRIIE